MNAKELLRKRDLCYNAAHACLSISMWKIWIHKGNQLHNMAMMAMESDDKLYNTLKNAIDKLKSMRHQEYKGKYQIICHQSDVDKIQKVILENNLLSELSIFNKSKSSFFDSFIKWQSGKTK